MFLDASAALEDLDVLARQLRDAHPHPYPEGMQAFYAAVAECVAAIPAAGLPESQFRRLLRPVLAAVRDGHTKLDEPVTGPRRYPVGWDVVEDVLYVARVGAAGHRGLLGGRLVTVNGRSVAELRAQYTRIRGCENRSHELTGVARALGDPDLAADLAGPSDGLELVVRAADGADVTVETTATDGDPEWIAPPSALEVPPADASGLGWGFLSADTVYLRVADLVGYREYREMMEAFADEPIGGHLDATSATELLRELVLAARAARAGRLIVDLRGNGGGGVALAFILGHFLYGLERTRRVDLGHGLTRYSALFAEHYPAMVTDVPAEVWAAGGYDFREENAWRAGELVETFRLEDYSPTFAAELTRGDLSAAWSPRVTVLIDAWTYSSGFQLAVFLHRMGADTVGVPSGQAGNSSGDTLGFTLPRSRIRARLSAKRFVMFPHDADQGRLWRPDHELTYAHLAAHDFDPNTTLALALDATAG
ncbi:S41 family peptidase [Longispora urticae]